MEDPHTADGKFAFSMSNCFYLLGFLACSLKILLNKFNGNFFVRNLIKTDLDLASESFLSLLLMFIAGA